MITQDKKVEVKQKTVTTNGEVKKTDVAVKEASDKTEIKAAK